MLSTPSSPGLFSGFGKVVALITTTCVLAACANTLRTEKASDDLVEVERGNFDHVLMLPDTALAPFERVYIDEPVVEMSDYWLRDYRGDYVDRDLERIKEDYGRGLKEALAETLAEKSRVETVDSAEEADMILRPTLRNLNIYAPDLLTRPARTDYYVESAGNATLDLEFVDPQTGTVVAQFVDHRETPAIVIGRLEETNRATNYRLFRRLMERWSNNLVHYLDQENVVPRR